MTTVPGNAPLAYREEKVDIRDAEGNVIGQYTALVLERTNNEPIITIDLTGWTWDRQ